MRFAWVPIHNNERMDVMGTMTAKSTSVVAFLTGQHEQIKQLFEQVIAAQGKERERTFGQLRRLLAVHEAAEEEIVHPAGQKVIPDGDQVVGARVAEEKKANRALAELATLDVSSAEFEQKIVKLQMDVLAHARAEETQEFKQLEAKVSPEKLESMERAAERVEANAARSGTAGVSRMH